MLPQGQGRLLDRSLLSICGTDQGGKDDRGSHGDENQPPPDDTAASLGVYLPPVSSEPSADGDLLVEGSDSPSSDRSIPPPTAARTAARQLESNLVGSVNSEEPKRTIAQTGGVDQEAS